MGNTQKWTFVLSMYFILVFILVTVSYSSGYMTTSQIAINTDYASNLNTDVNSSQLGQDIEDISIWNWNDYFGVVFSFFAFDIVGVFEGNILMQSFWIIRIFIVWLPLLGLLYSLYYSLPTVSS